MNIEIKITNPTSEVLAFLAQEMFVEAEAPALAPAPVTEAPKPALAPAPVTEAPVPKPTSVASTIDAPTAVRKIVESKIDPKIVNAALESIGLISLPQLWADTSNIPKLFEILGIKL